MNLRGGNGTVIQNYYNDYYAESFSANDFELLIVIKRFWVAGNSTSNDKRVEVANSGKDNNSIQSKWDIISGKTKITCL